VVCAGLLAAALLLAGCATVQQLGEQESAASRWEREVRRRGVDPATIADPLGYTEEMQRTARSVAGGHTQLEQLRNLQRYLFDEDRFPFDYESHGSYTAVEAFEKRTGNCVSFTNLFMALARSIGIEVQPALLVRPASAEQQGDLIVVNNHIVAVFDHSGTASIFDFNYQKERDRVGLARIDDMWVSAIYLNNRGAEELLQGNAREALVFLENAVKLAPEFVQAYGNLGVVRRQLGDVDGAFDAYRLALEIDSRYAMILNNLAALYQSLGKETEAHAALEAADLSQASPYLLLSRGYLEQVKGRSREALRFFRRAAKSAPQLAEPQLAIARAELALGRTDRARKALDRALVLDPTSSEARKLRGSLD
jgi:Tfp pilus assembly protein PilF